jgi:hypothetical protein
MSFDGVSIGKFIPVAVWETTCPPVTWFFWLSLPFLYCARTWKSVAPWNLSCGEVVLGYMQEGVTNVESESECAIESDHNMECVAARRWNQEVYP